MPKFNVKLVRCVTRTYSEQDHFLVCVEADSAREAESAVRALSAEKVTSKHNYPIKEFRTETKVIDCESSTVNAEMVKYALPAGKFAVIDLVWKPTEVTTPAPTL